MHDLGTRLEKALANAEAQAGIDPDYWRPGKAAVEPRTYAGAVLGDHGLGMGIIYEITQIPLDNRG